MSVPLGQIILLRLLQSLENLALTLNKQGKVTEAAAFERRIFEIRQTFELERIPAATNRAASRPVQYSALAALATVVEAAWTRAVELIKRQAG